VDIEIDNPIHMTLDVIELDDHLPSMKFSVHMQVEKFGGYNLNINALVWIECQSFDNFVINMRKGEVALLRDMNSNFELQIDPFRGCIEWSLLKEALDGYSTSARGCEKLTDESKRAFYDAFNNYPKWW
jgi:hypothetical protein